MTVAPDGRDARTDRKGPPGGVFPLTPLVEEFKCDPGQRDEIKKDDRP